MIAEEEMPDGVLIAGDVYDKPVPPAEAVQVFDAFLTDVLRRFHLKSCGNYKCQKLAFRLWSTHSRA